MEYYRYARIITNKGEQIIITCLMLLELEKLVTEFKGISYERKKRLALLFWK